jgi:hypothetical protein
VDVYGFDYDYTLGKASSSSASEILKIIFLRVMKTLFLPVLWIRIRILIRVGSGFFEVPGTVSEFLIQIRIQEGQNDQQK